MEEVRHPPVCDISHIPQRLDEALETCATPQDFWEEFISNDFLETTVRFTNAWIQRSNSLHHRAIQPTSVLELKLFFGVLMLMGVKKRQSFSEYWSTEPERIDPCIANSISRNRFKELHACLRFTGARASSIAHPVGLQHFFPVNPLKDEIVANSQRLRQPGGTLTVDESMVKFTGESSVRQSMPKKPTPEGYKIWALSDPYDGFLYSLDFYAGHEEPEERKPVTSIVLRLVTPYLDSGRTVFTDKFFTNHELAEELLDRETYLVGALSKARLSLSKPYFEARPLCFGQRSLCKIGPVYYTAYKGRKEGFYISTGRDPLATHPLTLRNPENHRLYTVQQPRVVTAYHSHAGGVDMHNQLRSFIEVDHRARRSYMRLVYYLLAVACVNSYLLYSKSHIPPPLHFFVELLARQMIAEGPRHLRDPYIVLPLSSYHRLEKAEKPAICKKKDCRNRCSYRCPICDLHFCVNCFWPVHKKLFSQGVIEGRSFGSSSS